MGIFTNTIHCTIDEDARFYGEMLPFVVSFQWSGFGGRRMFEAVRIEATNSYEAVSKAIRKLVSSTIVTREDWQAIENMFKVR